MRRGNDDSFLPREAGKGDHPSSRERAEDGGRGVRDEAYLCLDAPSTTRSLSSGRPLRAGPVGVVPLPRYAGADEERRQHMQRKVSAANWRFPWRMTRTQWSL